MAYYRVLTQTFINGMVADKGSVIEYDGTPSANLAPATQAQWAAARGRTASWSDEPTANPPAAGLGGAFGRV